MITLLALAITTLFLIFMLVISTSTTKSYFGWKVSGIWANESDTLQIIIHEEGSCLHGHIVSAQINKKNNKPIVGQMIVDHVKIKPTWKWSVGKYIDPYTTQVFDLKMKLKDGKTLKVCFVENDHIVRKEEWKLVNSF